MIWKQKLWQQTEIMITDGPYNSIAKVVVFTKKNALHTKKALALSSSHINDHAQQAPGTYRKVREKRFRRELLSKSARRRSATDIPKVSFTNSQKRKGFRKCSTVLFRPFRSPFDFLHC